jgi:hypothetical protein
MTFNEIDDLADEPDQKTITALVERLRKAGHTVHQDKVGRFLVTRWGVSRFCMDFESLQAFAKQVGVKP